MDAAKNNVEKEVYDGRLLAVWMVDGGVRWEFKLGSARP